MAVPPRCAGFSILVALGPRVSELVAYTTRLGELLEALDTLAPPGPPPPPAPHDDRADLLARSASAASAGARVEMCAAAAPGPGAAAPHICAEGLEVALPTGETLAGGVSFAVRPGDRLLIVGPAGCGKTSLLRILRGLWPVTKGALRRPSASQMVFLPQVSPSPAPSVCAPPGERWGVGRTAQGTTRLRGRGPRRGGGVRGGDWGMAPPGAGSVPEPPCHVRCHAGLWDNCGTGRL